jgi:hypothetical protein
LPIDSIRTIVKNKNLKDTSIKINSNSFDTTIKLLRSYIFGTKGILSLVYNKKYFYIKDVYNSKYKKLKNEKIKVLYYLFVFNKK